MTKRTENSLDAGSIGVNATVHGPQWIGIQEFDAFWDSLWRSELGKKWAKSETGLAAWLKTRLRARPFFFCQPWDPVLQRRHFSQMWGQVFARHYDNAALSDLYWVHELSHWASADFGSSESFEAWSLKWDINELRASCASEILVHGEVLGWDQEALGHQVWARQFGPLGGSDPMNETSWHESSRVAAARRLDLRDGRVEPEDEDERWFMSFRVANLGWAQVWSGVWQEVDQGLAEYERALRGGDEVGARAALVRAGAVDAFPHIPYQKQAEAFAAIS